MINDSNCLIAHHIGCLTDNIEKSIQVYRQIGFENFSEIFYVKAQKVKVTFVEIRKDFYLELVEFDPQNSSLKKIYNSANPYYHVGYLVKNMEDAIAELEQHGFHLVSRFFSEAFNGKSCAFFYSPEMHLVELIEA